MQHPSIHNDKELFLSIAQGDEQAFRALYDLYQQKVFFIAFKLLGSHETAKDVVQEVFFKNMV